MDKVCVTFNYGKCSNRREGDLLERGDDEGRARYFEKKLVLLRLLRYCQRQIPSMALHPSTLQEMETAYLMPLAWPYAKAKP